MWLVKHQMLVSVILKEHQVALTAVVKQGGIYHDMCIIRANEESAIII